MPPHPQRSSTRVLAPLALGGCALAVLVVIVASGGGDGSNETVQSQTVPQTSPATATEPDLAQPASYTVKPGDTLGGIAESTGVPVDVLQELNPELDPQALISGQKIKLRE